MIRATAVGFHCINSTAPGFTAVVDSPSHAGTKLYGVSADIASANKVPAWAVFIKLLPAIPFAGLMLA